MGEAMDLGTGVSVLSTEKEIISTQVLPKSKGHRKHADFVE